MKKTVLLSILLVLASGFFFKNYSTVRADVGSPVSITATYNSTTGQLSTSGSYSWEECEPGEETNVLGFGLFVNDGTPAANDSNALDGSTIHLVNNGSGCTDPNGSWEDSSHLLSSAPSKVCVVVYDVRTDDSADPGGIHSLIGAGGNYNTDNSWDDNGKSFSEGSCTTPIIINPTQCSEKEDRVCPTPNPSATPEPTPTPTPTTTTNGGSNGGGNNGGPKSCDAGKPPAPQLLSVVRNGSTAKLTWTLVPSANNYSILYGQLSGNYIYSVPSTGNTDHYTVNSLNPGTNYYFVVKAVNGCMPGDLSNERSTGGQSAGQVLGASTMAGTGFADQLIMLAVLVTGVLVTVKSGYAYAKAGQK